MADDRSPAAPSIAAMQAIVGLASACIGVYAAVQSVSAKDAADEAAERASQFKQQLEQRASDRADVESSARRDATAYEAVVRVLESSERSVEARERRQKAVVALVLATASDGMKKALLDVLGSSASVSPRLRESVSATATIVAEDIAAQAPQPSKPVAGASSSAIGGGAGSGGGGGGGGQGRLEGYKVVVFHCQSSSQPQVAQAQAALAKTLRSELEASPNAQGAQVDLRELPDVLNASPGYGVYSNQLRYNPDDNEEQSSLLLKQLLEATTVAQSNKLEFRRVRATKRTPNYLSVFVCGPAAAS